MMIPENKINLLMDYLHLLIKWNKAYNLTAIADPTKMISHHLLDSLVVASYIGTDTLVDIGTGAGLPGIPLAIVKPESHFILVDSNGKKTRFLFQVKMALSLSNVTIKQLRCESMLGQYDAIMSRAFSNLGDMLKVSTHLVKKTGSFWAMKGKYPEEELNSLPGIYKVKQVIKLHVPTLDEDRHLIEIIRKT